MPYLCGTQKMQAPQLHNSHEQALAQQPVLYRAVQQQPGSVVYSISRYLRPQDWLGDDVGVLRYHSTTQGTNKKLELHFCVAGNMYCHQQQGGCDNCTAHTGQSCTTTLPTADIISFQFDQQAVAQFVPARFSSGNLSDAVLSFTHQASFAKAVPICNKVRGVLEGLLNHNYEGSLQNIYINAQTQMLLLYSMDCLLGEKEIDTISCKFLANSADREKVARAREVLIQHIGSPITIKELSRKVAINECYLKKGFKEMFGTTIFEFYQNQRMEHAKYLLYEKGLSVTEVSDLLGYSSISHFSTAFKKHTGLKPCELLLR